MSDHIDELCALVKEAGGTMRLHGSRVSPSELRSAMEARVDVKLGALVGLPTPRLTATITPPTCKAGLGAVKVHGYTPPEIVEYCESGDPRAYGNRKPRKRAVCRRCHLPGHISSNEKFHPRPL